MLIGLTLACSGAVEVVPPSEIPLEFAAAQSQKISYSNINMPHRILSPDIDLDAKIVEMGWTTSQQWGQTVSEWNVPFSEAGWHKNSAGLGEGTNIVISGHNNSMGGRIFANVENLEIGQRLTLWNSRNEPFNYKITDRTIVRAIFASTETEAYLTQVMQRTDREQLTLITCWPSWSNTHRLVVIAEPSY